MPSQPLPRLSLTDEGFAFDPCTGESFVLNSTGLEILRRMILGQSQEQIGQGLMDEFGLEPVSIMGDLRDFSEQLRILNLLEASS